MEDTGIEPVTSALQRWQVMLLLQGFRDVIGRRDQPVTTTRHVAIHRSQRLAGFARTGTRADESGTMTSMATTSHEFPALAALAEVLRTSDRAPVPVAGPPPTLAEVHSLRREIVEVASRFGASDVRVVGSVARGSATPTSDVDFLVALDPERSLLDLGALQVALEELLGCPVHVVADTPAGPGTAPQTLREERMLERLRADAVAV
jgi:predicted nucleotidyltransferase